MEKIVLNGKLIEISNKADKNGSNYYILKIAYPYIKQDNSISIISKNVIINQYTNEFILNNFNKWLQYGWLKKGDYLEVEGYDDSYIKDNKVYSSVKPTMLNNLSIVEIAMSQKQEQAQVQQPQQMIQQPMYQQPQAQQPMYQQPQAQQPMYQQPQQTQMVQQQTYQQPQQQVVYQQPQTQTPAPQINITNPYQQ